MKKFKIIIGGLMAVIFMCSCSDNVILPEKSCSIIKIIEGDADQSVSMVVAAENIAKNDDFDALIQMYMAEYIAKNDVSGIVVNLYKETDYTYKPITSGAYIPNGDINQSYSIEAGDYKTFEYVDDFIEKQYKYDPFYMFFSNRPFYNVENNRVEYKEEWQQ